MLLHAIISLLLSLTTNVLALPNTPLPKLASATREARLEAFNAQRPMHTTALLAGAAAAPSASPKRKGRKNAPDIRIRDLQTLTGENGMWVSLEDLRRDGMMDEDDDTVDVDEDTLAVTEKSASIGEQGRGRERERWDMHDLEI